MLRIYYLQQGGRAMSNIEVNKYLTEKMGKCWHKGIELVKAMRWNDIVICPDCENRVILNKDVGIPHIDFYTWQGLGMLLNFAFETVRCIDINRKSVMILFERGKNIVRKDIHIDTVGQIPGVVSTALYNFLREGDE